MSVLPVGIGSSGVDTGDIGHSLRCRSAASAYLNKTFGTNTGNPFTASLWVKRGSLATRQFFFAATNGTNNSGIGFDATDHLVVVNNSGADNVSTAVYRDPTAPLHIVLQSNGTTVTVLVNNLQVLQFSASLTFFNTNVSHTIGRLGVSTLYFDGYISRVAFVSGSVEAPSSFGYLNTEINEWVSKSQSAVKAVVDAGGTNSFMLDFDDATSLTTLGYDKSSKGNNWTLNNFSLTAGTTYDHMLDVPGNSFATLNPLWRGANVTPTDGNLTNPLTTGSPNAMGPTMALFGKGYAELHNTAAVGSIGLCVTAANLANMQFTIGSTAVTGLWEIYDNTTGIYSTSDGAAFTGSLGASRFTGTTVKQFAWDVDAGKFWIGKDNVWYDSSWGTTGDPATGANPTFTIAATRGPFSISAGSNGATNALYWLFGQAPLHASATYQSAAGGYFRYTPPTGFKALCQRNLPDPAILNPEKHFDVVTRSGTSATYTKTGIQFAPELVWIKDRNTARSHRLFDIIRGATNGLFSDATSAETALATDLTAFTSDGYTLGAGAGSNATSETYVDWLWKMGGAAVTNNNGSISSQVSANVLAGQSVVTYTGTGANATVGHGLASAPELVIVKQRNGSTYSWTVQHKSVAAANVLFLEATSAATARATSFNSTYPTNSVFSVGTDLGTNANGNTYVALCFHSVPGYSKVGSYTGNGSADGPYVECGFKVKRLMVKRIDAVDSGWVTIDAIRDPYNTTTSTLAANTSSAESSYATTNSYDFVSTGFKPRHDGGTGYSNITGATYIYYAVADVAGKFALGR